MHARKKGKSGSTPPSRSSQSGWVSYEADEVVDIIVKFAREGKSPSMIGIIISERVSDAVSQHVEFPGSPGSHASIAGRRITTRLSK